MKRIAIVLCILAIVGCKPKHKQNGTSVPNSPLLPEVISITGEGIADTPDSLYIFHSWHDCGYLFDAPSKARISKWKMMCEEESDRVYYSWDIALYHSGEQLLAVNDLLGIVVCTDEDVATPEYDDFIIWRLSEYMPVDTLINSEFDRFALLENQIDSLINHDVPSGCMWDYNCRAELAMILEEAETRTMFRRLLKRADRELASMLKKEDAAFWRYHKVQSACFDTVTMSPFFNGTAAPIAYAGMAQADVLLRRKSLEAFHFFITDGTSSIDKLEEHVTIPLSMISDEYEKFFAELPANPVDEDPEFPEYYPLKNRQNSLREDKAAFMIWMEERDKISRALTGSRKEYFDQATNNARRYKLIMLKNRYEGYRIGTDEYFDALLKEECSDREMLEYHFPGDI